MALQATANPDPSDMTARVEALRNTFCRIQTERMQDVPLLNPVLAVATVGFRHWNAYYLGVLVTPWMMKLIGLPVLTQPLEHAEQTWRFASGEYTVYRDVVPGMGEYYSVSLFSPMQEFTEQAQAETTAMAVLEALFAAPRERAETNSLHSASGHARGLTRRQLLFGMFRNNDSTD
jgi:[NiFe] hydrogenase assembly HybE family chaperone